MRNLKYVFFPITIIHYLVRVFMQKQALLHFNYNLEYYYEKIKNENNFFRLITYEKILLAIFSTVIVVLVNKLIWFYIIFWIIISYLHIKKPNNPK